MDSLSIILALGAIAVAAYYYFTREDVFEKHGIPRSKGVPIFGSTWKVFLQRATFVDVVKETYNTNKDAKYIVFYDFSFPTIVIRDIELIKSISVKNFDHFVNHRTFLLDKTDSLFSKNLFFLKDEKWKEVRNTMSPVFTSSKLKTMFGLMNDCAKKYGENLTSLPETDQTELELKDVFSRYATDIIATCAFGIDIDSMKDENNEFYTCGKSLNNLDMNKLIKFFIIRNLPWLSNLLNLRIVESKIEKFFIDMIDNNIKTREERGINRPDVIQTMMESRKKLGPGKSMTTADITAQGFIFFLAGFDPVATTMSFAAYELGVNQEIQKKLQEEIDRVLLEHGDVTYDALMGMEYLDAVVNETTRMYPVQPFTDRICSERFELPPALPGAKPFVVKKGDCVQFPIYGIQRDEKYFKNPDKFDPNRFLGQAKKDLDPNSLLTFGLGPRMCIGNRFALLEVKVLLFHVFARCNIIPCPKTTIPLVFDKTKMNFMPINGFWFEIQPRKETAQVYEYVKVMSHVY
ncbi:cytochrome P450 9e2-like [Ceratina calcarata]|uniref:Cytochrome P450 9e2-like n=1 Tax=Ceratina calcarata TaxID=156304 RepID=A0AAJ7J0Z4_9HYME|nr:cytochrome P450 9e2-like [Ceratina calcarata]